jgi:hypothetical protein
MSVKPGQVWECKQDGRRVTVLSLGHDATEDYADVKAGSGRETRVRIRESRLGPTIDRYRLVQDVAAEAAIARVRALHKPFGIYDECGHDHEPDDPGVVHVDDIGYTCAKLYDVCYHCCTDSGDNHIGCAEAHDHGPGKPICATIAALDGPQDPA